jgi:GDP-L-fucose synthase
MKNFFQRKKILVAGGTGLVGQKLVPKLIKLGGLVDVASLDHKSLCPEGVKNYYKLNLIDLNNCKKVTKGKDIVFNLMGVTGTAKINYEKPASFMMSNLYSAINLLVGAKNSNVENYLYTSTYGVYAPSKIMKEPDVWRTFPSEHDKYAGWAKRIGELQIEAFKKEYKFDSLHIVRPANIFGPYANFDPKSSMVVASLIKRACNESKILKVWGDGSSIRDFIYSEDVADAMIKVVQKKIETPINIGSGKGYSIKKLVNTIVSSDKIKKKPKIVYDKSKPSGDKIRILDVTLAKKNGIYCKFDLKTAVDLTIDWYLNNSKSMSKRYNFFN